MGKEFPYLPAMIHSQLTSKAQTTIPRAVREALGLKGGDTLAYVIEGDEVKLQRARLSPDPFVNNFATFTEWASDADCEAFDNL